MFQMSSTKSLCLCLALLLTQLMFSTGHDGDIVKRQLRWNTNKYIVSDTMSTIRIDNLIPHSGNVNVLDNRNYIAFNIYKRNGIQAAPNAGIFHFIDENNARQHRSYCPNGTMHKGAYHYFYNRCPDDDSGLVASGYCYQGTNGQGLVYHSYTFNSGNMKYLDGHYYLDTTNQMHEIEQTLVRECFNSWKSAGFPIASWTCSLDNIPVAAGLSALSKSSEVSSGQCEECECSVSQSTSISALWNFTLFVASIGCFLVLQSLL